jgi:hypothetical protein
MELSWPRHCCHWVVQVFVIRDCLTYHKNPPSTTDPTHSMPAAPPRSEITCPRPLGHIQISYHINSKAGSHPNCRVFTKFCVHSQPEPKSVPATREQHCAWSHHQLNSASLLSLPTQQTGTSSISFLLQAGPQDHKEMGKQPGPPLRIQTDCA